ncbi:MAG: iron ABC transporter permease [Limnochordales bacterium]|nr:iron ABC transporter permease [Limnochordales bacterium]
MKATTQAEGRKGREGLASAQWRRWLAATALLAPPIAFLLLFLAYPLAQIWQEAGGTRAVSALWSVVTDPYFQQVIRFTAWQALLSTLLSVLLGFPLAYLLSNFRFPGRQLLRSLTLVPFVLPTISVAVGFLLMFGNNGLLNRLLFGLFGFRLPVLYSLQGVLLAHAFYNAPLLVRTINGSWEALDPSLEEAARSLGASPARVFFTITLPALLPGIATGAALAFVFSFLSFPLVLTLGGGRLATIEVEIYTQVRLLLDYRTGAALALLETLISLIFSYGYLALENHFARPLRSVRPRPLQQISRPRSVAGWLGAAALALALVLLGLLYVGPIGVLVYHSLRMPRSGELTLAWYRYIFAPEYDAILGDTPLMAVRNSILVALGATALSLLVATPLTWYFTRKSWRGQALCESLAMSPLAISSVALGFGMLRAFNRPPLLLSGTIWIIIAVHAVLAYPFVIRALRPALAAISREAIESSRTLGASAGRTFLAVELPLAATGLLTGAMLSFGFSLAEMSATVLLAGPGFATMPVTLYHLLAARNFGGASAMAVFLLVVTAFCFVALEAAGRRWLEWRPARRAE